MKINLARKRKLIQREKQKKIINVTQKYIYRENK